mgnify:CR=1 FL=1
MNGTLEIGNMNRSMIMQLIFKQPGITRAGLAKSTGLTGAAVSKIVQTLLDIEVIRETGYVTGHKGRRAIGLEINNHLFNVLAFRISRREIDWGLYDLSMNALESDSVPLYSSSTEEDILSIIRDQIEDYLENYRNIKAISIAAPGPFDINSKKVLGITGLGKWIFRSWRILTYLFLFILYTTHMPVLWRNGLTMPSIIRKKKHLLTTM